MRMKPEIVQISRSPIGQAKETYHQLMLHVPLNYVVVGHEVPEAVNKLFMILRLLLGNSSF
jgi:hypothetical protein